MACKAIRCNCLVISYLCSTRVCAIKYSEAMLRLSAFLTAFVSFRSPLVNVQTTPVSHIFPHYGSMNVRNPGGSHIFPSACRTKAILPPDLGSQEKCRKIRCFLSPSTCSLRVTSLNLGRYFQKRLKMHPTSHKSGRYLHSEW